MAEQQAEHLEEDTGEESDNQHYVDPVDQSRTWCGKAISDPGSHFHAAGQVDASVIACVVCAELGVTKKDWWWRVHRAAHPDCSCRRS